jgi:hypothetical protein
MRWIVPAWLSMRSLRLDSQISCQMVRCGNAARWIGGRAIAAVQISEASAGAPAFQMCDSLPDPALRKCTKGVAFCFVIEKRKLKARPPAIVRWSHTDLSGVS